MPQYPQAHAVHAQGEQDAQRAESGEQQEERGQLVQGVVQVERRQERDGEDAHRFGEEGQARAGVERPGLAKRHALKALDAVGARVHRHAHARQGDDQQRDHRRRAEERVSAEQPGQGPQGHRLRVRIDVVAVPGERLAKAPQILPRAGEQVGSRRFQCGRFGSGVHLVGDLRVEGAVSPLHP